MIIFSDIEHLFAVSHNHCCLYSFCLYHINSYSVIHVHTQREILMIHQLLVFVEDNGGKSLLATFLVPPLLTCDVLFSCEVFLQKGKYNYLEIVVISP